MYLLRDRTLVKITRDDSFVGFLEDSKRLSEQEAMNHPKRNEISKALGFDPNIAAISDYIETGISPFLPGDILLLCSDGLTDMIDSKKIVSILTTKDKIGQKIQALIDAANQAGGKDNVTAVLVHNTNKPAALEVTKPTIVKKNELQTENDEQEDTGEGQRKSRPVKNRGWIVFLLLLCLGLLGALIWQFSRDKDANAVSTSVPFVPRNVAEQRLQDSIRQTDQLILADSVYGKLISLTDTIILAKDSIHINGNGIILRSDTGYHSAAMLIHADCKYVVLENIVFEDFLKAIVSKSNEVQLKNVRFRNCNVALQYDLRFSPDYFVNGLIVDTLFFKTDSLPK